MHVPVKSAWAFKVLLGAMSAQPPWSLDRTPDTVRAGEAILEWPLKHVATSGESR